MDAGRNRCLWRLIWKWPGPQRIRTFLWLAVKERLLTNKKRARRHLISFCYCEWCGIGSESALHVLRDCQRARLIWKSLLPPHRFGSFFNGTLKQWFQANLSCSELNCELPWSCVFAVAVWRIWFWRNSYVFQADNGRDNKVADILSRVTEIHNTMSRFSHFNEHGRHMIQQTICWSPPSHDWMKINTNGAHCSSSSQSTAGGVIRDWCGRICTSYWYFFYKCSRTMGDFLGSCFGLGAWLSDGSFRNG